MGPWGCPWVQKGLRKVHESIRADSAETEQVLQMAGGTEGTSGL